LVCELVVAAYKNITLWQFGPIVLTSGGTGKARAWNLGSWCIGVDYNDL